jgi:hypothetical protein
LLTDEELTETERRLVRLIDEPGEAGLDIRIGDDEVDEPGNADAWPPEREVRAGLLAELLNGQRPLRTAQPRPFTLIGIRLTGRLDLNRATLVRPLSLYGCTADEEIDLSDALTLSVSLGACRLAGIHAQLVAVKGNFSLRWSRNDGRLDLLGARIDRQLLLGGAELVNPGGFAMSASGLTVEQRMFCTLEAGNRPFTAGGEIELSDSVSVRERLGWVARHEGGFAPGPYDQLAAGYRRTGHVEDARRVGYAKLRRRQRVVAWPGKVWNVLLQVTVGYGYHPWRAALWLLAAGSAVFAASYPADLVAAREPVPDFQPVAYTLDIMLPLDLGQQSARLAALASSWVLVIAGWILAAMFLAGVTNALKRD